MMDAFPHVCLEYGLSVIQWLEKKQNAWGGDLELHLLTIGLKRDIVVIPSVNCGERS